MIPYPDWIRNRLAARRSLYTAERRPGLLSLVTPVYDTPPPFLRALACSVLRQDYPWFEWVVVDNGSRQPGTRRCLQDLRDDDRVKLIHIEQNQGIMGGTRTAVAHATGRYVLPVDSDDLLYPDALRIIAATAEASGFPALLYSDEDKIEGEGDDNAQRCHPFLKPDWDPVLFWNICYVAHLCVIDRAEAIRLGAYSDDSAAGCHDWDTFLRFVRAGHQPLHVPEVLYSWRMHAGSTSTPGTSPKAYTLGSQRHVLATHLQSVRLADRLEVRTNPLFGDAGLWQVARKHVDGPPHHVLLHSSNSRRTRLVLQRLAESDYPALCVNVMGDWRGADGVGSARPGFTVTTLDAQDLQSPAVLDLLARLPQNEPVVVWNDRVKPLALDWPWEVLGLMELHADAAVVGGRILDEAGRVLLAAEVFGMDGFLASPDRGRGQGEKGLYGLHICQRSADAVSGLCFAARADFLRQVLGEPVSLTHPQLLSAWLGARARQANLRVIYTPHLAAQGVASQIDEPCSAEARKQFAQEFGFREFDDRHYSRHYGRTSAHGYKLAEPRPLQRVLAHDSGSLS
jgi:hypothetical protein